MKLYLKSIIIGLGGVSPGLSGSVLMILFGLYEPVLEALGTLFRHFKEKLRFLLPIVAGMVTGVLLFSKLLNYLLSHHEVPTRFCFLGLILGTVPLFWQEVRKKGFAWYYWLVIAAAFAGGMALFTVNAGSFTQVTDPTLWHKILLGFAVATSAIVPGVDPAVLLSSLGLYELYVSALAELDFSILLPMVIGLAAGAVVVSFLMSHLIKRFHTTAFSVIFGVFLAMIPNMLTPECRLSAAPISIWYVALIVIGFGVSYFLGKTKKE